MKPVLLLLSLLALVSPVLAETTYTLTVKVTNIPGAKGDLLIGVYDSAKSFTGSPLPQSPKIKLTSDKPVTAKIAKLKPGTYAVAVIQDLNGNGVLDKNFIGMPTEPLAFSVIKKIPMGKPSFDACSFEIKDANVSMTIPLVLE